ncbi:predicted protein [Botrytis cinerea T4]|uniref:Uncharacterized protein n=1 Tax=Botryotinia fuckeliana (strain T4) TaxID=999810 RepID=G2XZN1_BOTF4|nr:predicted protein [Botrytis cinerea T4]
MGGRMEKGSVVADEEEAGDGSNVEEETALILRRRTRVRELSELDVGHPYHVSDGYQIVICPLGDQNWTAR